MSQEKERPPQLRIEYSPNAGQVIELNSARSRFVIGRSPYTDLRIDSPKISRQHAEIIFEAERYFLVDLNSRNGTFLNGERIEEKKRLLKDGDEIQLGTELVLRFGDPAMTTPDTANPILRRGLWLEASRQQVYINRRKLEPPLSDQLFGLLALLYGAGGEIIAKDQIADRLWPEAKGGVADQPIDKLVHRLRKRLAEIDDEHEYVVTVRNMGLKFVQRE